MFRKMRRFRQELTNEQSLEILKKHTTGVLAVTGDDGYPYTVPLNYIYEDGKIWFHWAKQGHKLDAVEKDDKVSFCVVDKDDIEVRKYTNNFCSVVAFGRIHRIEDDDLKQHMMDRMLEVYGLADASDRAAGIRLRWNYFYIMAMDIEHMTGKAALQLVQ